MRQSWLVQPFASRRALPLEVYRICAGVMLLGYFIENLFDALPLVRDGFLGPGASVEALAFVWGAGAVLSALVVVGVLPRFCSLLIWWATAFGVHWLRDAAYVQDYVVSQLALWLGVLPIGRMLRLLPSTRCSAASQRAGDAGWVNGIGIDLFLVGQAMLYANVDFWRSAAPEWKATPLTGLALVALPLLSIATRFRWTAVALHVLLLTIAFREGLGAISLALVPAALVYLTRARPLPGLPDPRFELPHAVAAAYLLALFVADLPALPPLRLVHGHSVQFLTDLVVVRSGGLAPLPDTTQADLVGSDARGDPVELGSIAGRGRRERILRSWLGGGSSNHGNESKAGAMGALIARRITARTCANVATRPPITVRFGVEGAVAVRFGCRSPEQSARLMAKLQGASRPTWLDPSAVVGSERCRGCHAEPYRAWSASPHAHALVTASRVPYAEAGVGCEACHGAGAAHVAAREGGHADPYAGWTVKNGKDDVDVCGGCHGLVRDFASWDPERHVVRRFLVGLEDPTFRSNGRSLSSSIQLQPLEASRCRVSGHVTCLQCHSHHGEPETRSRAAEAAVCTGCHQQMRSAVDSLRHSHHGPAVPCVACHMAVPMLSGGRERAVVDHTISVPRTRESTDQEGATVCAGCHPGNETQRIESVLRGWIVAAKAEPAQWVVRLARARDPRSAPETKRDALRSVLEEENVSDIVAIGALRLLRSLPSDTSLVPLLRKQATSARSEIRAAALDALITHDPAGADAWMGAAFRDQDPLVMLEVGSARIGYLADHDEELGEFVQGAVRHYVHPPTTLFEKLAALRAGGQNRVDGRALLELAVRHASPAEQPSLKRRLAAWE